MTNQSERVFNPARLSARRVYKGGRYVQNACRPIERTGKEWRELLKYLTCKIVNGTDVLAIAQVMDRDNRPVPSLTYEVYLDA